MKRSSRRGIFAKFAQLGQKSIAVRKCSKCIETMTNGNPSSKQQKYRSSLASLYRATKWSFLVTLYRLVLLKIHEIEPERSLYFPHNLLRNGCRLETCSSTVSRIFHGAHMLYIPHAYGERKLHIYMLASRDTESGSVSSKMRVTGTE